MKKGIKILLIVCIVAAALAITGTVVMRRIQGNLDALKTTEIPRTDLQRIEDGTYTGRYSVFPVSATVEVTVENHVITGIRLVEHKNGKGQAAESIPGEVVRTQSLQVDAVSGATYSSKVILLAIADALDGETA
ncbi:FMN-binding protein [Papillibacter cinnamivorans]|uniref:FMN-binding domain-containing protein n=1 Tax=Papillibacter cinnamivorans DSM 12816 TaxID=1122930 RepID=A0A1W2CAH1_9FIRM|nr:FMN-binding protein [Papillibacter cinnamivorans]SMC81964.1 FMN-binding domain-containing protein [Papillibacter cinnamivorans DSM 12816]